MQSLPRLNHLKALLLTCKSKFPIAQIHAVLITTGQSTTNAHSLVPVISACGRIGDVTTARILFDELSERGISAWNSIINAYSRRNYPNEVLNLYHEMVTEGVRPDRSTFTAALKACSGSMDLELGKQIWGDAVDFGYGGDVYVGSSVLNLYVKCGEMEKAEVVFDKMVKRDVVCWTTMITGFVQSGQALKAVETFRSMQKEGVGGDGIVMMSLIQACTNLGDSKLGLSVHGYTVRRQMVTNDVVIQTSLVDMYAKNGRLEHACHIFKEIPCKNAVSWGALISGFAQNGFSGHVLGLLVEMQSLGFEPDLVSLIGALLACSQVGYLKLGKSIHCYITRRFVFERNWGTALIDMYAKCGALSSVYSVFDKIEYRDLILWNAMIDSYGVHGRGKEALSLFLMMRETNFKPDHGTFTALLSAFAHSGLVEEGRYWFNVMVNEYKIQPSEKHYSCMVDLLSRAGQVEEAYQLIKSMETKPGIAVWVALLSGCHNYRKLMIGEVAAKKILESNPEDLGIHSLVSNFFSMAGRWDEVAALRKKMKKTGMRKVPGYSALEVNGKHLAFLMEDKSHSQFGEMVHILDSLNHEMRVIS